MWAYNNALRQITGITTTSGTDNDRIVHIRGILSRLETYEDVVTAVYIVLSCGDSHVYVLKSVRCELARIGTEIRIKSSAFRTSAGRRSEKSVIHSDFSVFSGGFSNHRATGHIITIIRSCCAYRDVAFSLNEAPHRFPSHARVIGRFFDTLCRLISDRCVSHYIGAVLKNSSSDPNGAF